MYQPEKLLKVASKFSHEDFVRTVFRTYLRRNPDNEAYSYYSKQLYENQIDRDDFIRQIQSSEEFQKKSANLEESNQISDSNNNHINIGVNVIEFTQEKSDLRASSKANIQALKAAGIPVKINQVKSNSPRDLKNARGSYGFSYDNDYPINIIHVSPEQLFKVIDYFGDQYFENRYNIGFWDWEMPKFESLDGQIAFDFLDEIWTPSNYTSETISAVSTLPIVKIMHSVSLPIPSLNREDLKLPNNKFIFLFMFDSLDTFERKNPEGILQAFIKAFGNSNQDVLLVIKTCNLDQGLCKRDEFKELIAKYPSIRLIDHDLLKEEVNALIYNCDCYVSLHKSEGFGLNLAKAMFYGKPTIATGYSANTEFMNVGNSFLVKYHLVELEEDHGTYKKGDICAEPDIDHAAFLMEYVLNNYRQASQIGTRASHDIKSILSPEKIGIKIKNRVEYIYKEKLSITSSKL
ncbi:MAG: glycosyltransferase [Xenococcaceae cyanobacterium MO_234.B1]|nr:glycosyltransferase [Xenococcaceae cyanobacterium MO_234.B1]